MAESYTKGDKPTAKKPKFELPDDFEDEPAFLEDMRKTFADDVQFDFNNRQAALEDMRFFAGEQWNSSVVAKRDSARKPTLTINRLIAYVAQIVGNRRLNETTIKVVPDNGGEKQTAQVREDLIRSIQKISKAEQAYDKALENSTICGIGNFSLHLDYTDDDVFEQEIKIKAINDALAVVWDRTLTEPTGRDANHVFVQEVMPQAEFRHRWPWATPSDMMADIALRGDQRMSGWVTIDDVRIVSYWRMRSHRRTLALMQDGKVVDLTDNKDPDVLSAVQSRPDGSPYLREVDRKYAEMYLCSGLDILEGPYRLPVSRVPVYRVPGWEINTGEWRHRWGLVRFLKDPQRLHNYWRSTVAEKLMQTPRAVWLAASTAVEGREKAFRESHITDDPLLVYNGDAAQKPERVMPAQIEEALIGESQMSVQDMRDVSNLHEASLGMPSNEVSGKAILARQKIGDLGTVLYHDNLNNAIEECGKTVNELLNVTYDSPRIVKVLGPEGKDDLQAINDMTNPKSVDITSGKYSVSLISGPSYMTKRIEAAESMLAFVNAAPQVAAVAMDLIAEAQDWPKADELAKRLRKMLPPGMADPSDMSPEEQQSAQGQAQQAQQQAQMAAQVAMLKAQNLQADTTLKMATAQQRSAAAQAAPAHTQIEALNAQSNAQAKAHKAAMDTIAAAEGKP
jgi:hypothetical protein